MTRKRDGPWPFSEADLRNSRDGILGMGKQWGNVPDDYLVGLLGQNYGTLGGPAEWILSGARAELQRRQVEATDTLAYEMDQARSGVARGLDKLTLAIAEASKAADVSARDAVDQSRRMVRATWALVIVTLLLGVATCGLVIGTLELARTPPTIITVPGAR